MKGKRHENSQAPRRSFARKRLECWNWEDVETLPGENDVEWFVTRKGATRDRVENVKS
jgi:hypothetical protein